MPPRTALAFGAAVGVTVTYFVGLLSGLSLGTLLWRTAIGGAVLGAFAFVMVWVFGDPLDWSQPEPEEQEGGEGAEEEEGEDHDLPETEEEEDGGTGRRPAYPSDRDLE
jgi:hypothetical protein